MRPRALYAVPALLALSTAIMLLGPYRELSSRAAPDKLLDEAPPESAAAASALLGRLGTDGRDLYRQHFWWDLGFVLANAGAFEAR